MKRLASYLLVITFITSLVSSCEKNEKPPIPSIEPCETLSNTVDMNNWRLIVSSNGSWGYDQIIGHAGGTFPKDSNNYALFGGGIFVGALKSGLPSVSWVQHQSEYRPGIISNSQPASIENLIFSSDPTSCIYKIDATHSGYGWENWPIAYGAPADQDNNPILISSQDSWTVYHDIDSSKQMAGSTNPVLGIEVRQSTYMFTDNQYAGTSDVVFFKLEITNKSTNNYSAAYVGIWSDIDLGGGARNLVGSDTSENMIYMYNDSSNSFSGENLGYAAGYQLLYFTDGGGLNAKSYASIWYKKSVDEDGSDENQYNLLRGLNKDGTPRTYGDVSNPTIDFPGDPVTSSGIIDTAPMDKRILFSVGPFTFVSGASKEIVFALIGSKGADRLQAVTNLKTKAGNIEAVFTNQIAALLDLH